MCCQSLKNQRWLMLSNGVSFRSYLRWEGGGHDRYLCHALKPLTDQSGAYEALQELARATVKSWTCKWRSLWKQCSRARLAVKHTCLVFSGFLGWKWWHVHRKFIATRCGLPASGLATKVLGRREGFWRVSCIDMYRHGLVMSYPDNMGHSLSQFGQFLWYMYSILLDNSTGFFGEAVACELCIWVSMFGKYAIPNCHRIQQFGTRTRRRIFHGYPWLK